jgi:hypothetical protein
MFGISSWQILARAIEDCLLYTRIIKGRPFWSRFGVLGSISPERNTLYDDY